MIVIPTVELRHGMCVRPSHPANGSGSGSPLGEAIGVVRGWANIGFRRIHLIDADAIAGTGSNEALVDEIIRDGAVEVEACDAAESSDRIEQLVDAGAVRVVLGPRALSEPEWLAGACELFPGMLIVATDVRERRVVTRGWVRSLPLDILDVANDLSGLPLGGLLVSTAPGESPRTGSDLALIEDVVEACDFSVIVSGGVASMNDLRALEHRGVSAVVLGDPLYSGAIDPHNASMEFDE